MAEPGAGRRRLQRIAADGARSGWEPELAIETPVAIEINGLGYAVLMATPCDLVDLARGFLHAERLILDPAEIVDVDIFPRPDGVLVRVTVAAAAAERIGGRVRHRTTDGSCGLCGVENLEQALRPLPPLPSPVRPRAEAVFAALAAMRDHQPLNRATGAVHAALACAGDGRVLMAREDVGRHNAFDKLVGAMQAAGQDWGDGFALLSSRCSYELVEKAVLAGCGALVTVSAATTLALDRAAAAGLTLLPLARSDAYLLA